MLTLQTKDGSLFKVNRTTIVENSRNGIFCHMLYDLLHDADVKDDEPIPFSCVSTAVMRKIIEFAKVAEQHTCDPVPQRVEDRANLKLTDWQREWTTNLQEYRREEEVCALVLDIIGAANYMDIPLLRSVCMLFTVDCLFNGKGRRQMRTILGIKESPTNQQRTVVLNDNEWLRTRSKKQKRDS